MYAERTRGKHRSTADTTVLVVEDRREAREGIMRALAEQGHALTVATTGPDGVEAALASTPDLVVLDLGVPGMDGLEVTDALRQRGVSTPILLLTARAGVRHRVTAQ